MGLDETCWHSGYIGSCVVLSTPLTWTGQTPIFYEINVENFLLKETDVVLNNLALPPLVYVLTSVILQT